MDKYDCDLDVMCGFFEQPLDGEWAEHVTAYHVTPRSNVAAIKASGLVARECQATPDGRSRRPAVYLFAAKQDAYDQQVRNFLFDTDDLAVVRVTIPAAAFASIRHDGLFNLSCICSDGSYPTGIQFIGDIPATWIKA